MVWILAIIISTLRIIISILEEISTKCWNHTPRDNIALVRSDCLSSRDYSIIFNKLSLSSPRAGLGIVVMKVFILKVGEILIGSWSGRETVELAEVGNN